MLELQPDVSLTHTQSCAPGDGVSLIVQAPPLGFTAADFAILECRLEAEMSDGTVNHLGRFHCNVRPTLGNRVVACAALPGVVTYRATWLLRTGIADPSPSADDLARIAAFRPEVGMHASLVGSGGFGLRVLDAEADGALPPAYGTNFSNAADDSSVLVARPPGHLLELYGANIGAKTVVQFFDARALPAPGAVPFDEFLVPADGSFARTYPAPRFLFQGLTFACSSTLGSYTADAGALVLPRYTVTGR